MTRHHRVPPVRPQTTLAVVIGGAILMTVLSACSSSSTDGDFVAVDAVVSKVGPKSLGEVVTDTRSGKADSLGKSPTRRVSVVTDVPAAAALEQVRDRALAAGGKEDFSDHYTFSGDRLVGLTATTAGGHPTVDGKPLADGDTLVTLLFVQSQ